MPQLAPAIDVVKAVRANRDHAARQLWTDRFAQICQILGLEFSVSETDFALAVAGWQKSERTVKADGILGPKSWKKLEEQTRFSVAPSPLPPWLSQCLGGGKVAASAPTSPSGVPPWIDVARRELASGVEEGKGLDANNPRILEYLSSVSYLADVDYKVKDPKTGKKVSSGKKMGEVDETPWCGCFVNWCLIKAGQPRGPSARAKDWLDYGTKITTPRLGAIAVVYHPPGASTAGTTSSGFHVAFHIDGVGDRLTLLGGNQGNKVSERSYKGYWTVQGYTWPGRTT